MCSTCLSSQIDFISSLQSQKPLVFCGDCGRSQHGQRWLILEPESAELLALLLNRIQGIPSSCKLVEGEFIWTEPHSLRVRVRVVIEGEVLSGTILRQAGVVSFVMEKQQCPNCRKSFTDKTWSCCLQLRQQRERGHVETFKAIEKEFINASLDHFIVSVEEKPLGLDFFFTSKADCKKVMDYLKANYTVRQNSRQPAKQASSFTFSMDLAPLKRFDLISVPKGPKSAGLGIVNKVASSIHCIDPLSASFIEIPASRYWKSQSTLFYNVFCSLDQAVEVFVLDVEIEEDTDSKFARAEVTCIRSAELGLHENYLFIQSHLGKILRAGDTVLAYDLKAMSLSESQSEVVDEKNLPELLLVKKQREERKKSKKKSKIVSELANSYIEGNQTIT